MELTDLLFIFVAYIGISRITILADLSQSNLNLFRNSGVPISIGCLDLHVLTSIYLHVNLDNVSCFFFLFTNRLFRYSGNQFQTGLMPPKPPLNEGAHPLSTPNENISGPFTTSNPFNYSSLQLRNHKRRILRSWAVAVVAVVLIALFVATATIVNIYREQIVHICRQQKSNFNTDKISNDSLLSLPVTVPTGEILTSELLKSFGNQCWGAFLSCHS